ncbi:MAG: small-conductance mechanosensitive channel [Halovenus sp.]|jgi:small-conductance mechanosensitive channel
MEPPGATQVPDQFDAFEQFVRDLATTEGRLVTTAGVVIAALLVGLVVVPLVVRGGSRLCRQQVLPGDIVDILDVVNAHIPGTIADLTVRLLQVAVLFVAGVALLVTWGMIDIAVTVVQVLWRSLPFAGQVLLTTVILVVAYTVADVTNGAIREFGAGNDRVTEHQEEIMIRVSNVAVLVVVVSGLLTLWGLDISGLLLGAGVLGIVLGLAARQTLGSMIAGFVLMFTRPFTVGDWVEIGDHEGAVTHITIMHTEIREFNGELVIIPNDVVSEQSIRNRSHQDILRLDTQVGIDYDSDPEHAEAIALEAVEAVDEVTDGPPPETTTKAFGDSAVILEVLYWVEDPTPLVARRATESVIYELKRRFEEEGIEMPFPQRRLGDQFDADAVRPHSEATDGDGPD